jgi:hypothetical protein
MFKNFFEKISNIMGNDNDGPDLRAQDQATYKASPYIDEPVQTNARSFNQSSLPQSNHNTISGNKSAIRSSTFKDKIKLKIFPSSENISIPTSSVHRNNYIHELRDVLTEEQLKSFNFDFYHKLNYEEQTIQSSSYTRKLQEGFNFKVIDQNMMILKDFELISMNLKANQSQIGYRKVFSDEELWLFMKDSEVDVINYLFKKYRGLVQNRGILENKHFIENEVFEIKEYINGQMLRNSNQKLNSIEVSFRIILTVCDQAHDALIKIRKQRYCIMEIKKSLSYQCRVHRRFHIRKNLETTLALIFKYKEKLQKMLNVLGESFSIPKAANLYKSLTISMIYCHNKLKDEVKLKILESIAERLDGRLMYLRHKLKQSFFFELRMSKVSEAKFDRSNFNDIIYQFASVEKLATAYLNGPAKSMKFVTQMLNKDSCIFESYLKEIEFQSGILLDSDMHGIIKQQYANAKSSYFK